MHSNRRCFLGLGAAAAAALMLTSMHVPEAHANIFEPPPMLGFGMTVRSGITGQIHVAIITPDGARQIRSFDVVKDQWHRISFSVPEGSAIAPIIAGEELMIADHSVTVRANADMAFVDGVYDVPGGAQLKGFYHDLYRPYGPNRTVAAMQPDNGAGQVSGDRAQSVGRAGDLKATRPDGVKSGTTPGAKSIDATKTSWLRRIGPWFFRQPLPS